MAPTIIDVARRAKVSIGTASNALNGHAQVRESTRQRVQIAADALGYRPNLVARSLIERRTATIGLIVPDIANPYFAELTRGIERGASEAGLAILLANARNDVAAQAQALSALLDRRVDGLVLVPVGDESDLAGLDGPSTPPVVLADRTVHGWRGDSVTSDPSHTMRLAVDHLVGLGHRHIAVLAGDPSTSTGRERAAATRRRLAHHRLDAVEMLPTAFDLDAGLEATRSIILASAATAIVATADVLALGAIEALRGERPISVIGVDGIAFGRLVTPALTVVAQPTEQLGQLAARRLVERLAGAAVRGRVRLRGPLVVRDSTSPLATTSLERTAGRR